MLTVKSLPLTFPYSVFVHLGGSGIKFAIEATDKVVENKVINKHKKTLNVFIHTEVNR